MNQARIMELLREAAKPECSEEKALAILADLNRGTAIGSGRKLSSEPDRREARGMRRLMLDLFNSTYANHRAALPGLFPTFAMICGDVAPGWQFAAMPSEDIDWSLMGTPRPT